MLKQSVRSFNFSSGARLRTIGVITREPAMTTISPPTSAPRRQRLLHAIGYWLRHPADAWRAARRRAADRRLLQAMSDAELRDLGLGRGEAAHWTQAAERMAQRRW